MHLVIHNSSQPGPAHVAHPSHKRRYVLQPQPDRLGARLSIALAGQKTTPLCDQSQHRIELRNPLGWLFLVQDERGLPLVGLKQQIPPVSN